MRDIEITRATEGDEPPVLMADGEYVGHLPVKVLAKDSALRVLVPPAVAEVTLLPVDSSPDVVFRQPAGAARCPSGH